MQRVESTGNTGKRWHSTQPARLHARVCAHQVKPSFAWVDAIHSLSTHAAALHSSYAAAFNLKLHRTAQVAEALADRSAR
jgi:hypothetical protein